MTTSIRGGANDLPPSPKLWLTPAIACALSYALYNLCIKKSSSVKGMDPLVGGVVLQLVAAVVGLALVAVRRTGGAPKAGLVWAMAAGVSVGAAELLSFVIGGLGVPITQSIPVVVGGSVLIGTLMGRLWLSEVMSVRGWMGVLLIAVGIALVGMDPGGSAMH